MFDSAKPGVVSIKSSLGDEWKDVVLLTSSKDALDAAQLPPVIPPGGLSLTRKQYLYNQIRLHVPVEFQDELCPKPAVSDPSAMDQE